MSLTVTARELHNQYETAPDIIRVAVDEAFTAARLVLKDAGFDVSNTDAAEEFIAHIFGYVIDSAEPTRTPDPLPSATGQVIPEPESIHDHEEGPDPGTPPHNYSDHAGAGFCFHCGLAEKHPEARHVGVSPEPQSASAAPVYRVTGEGLPDIEEMVDKCKKSGRSCPRCGWELMQSTTAENTFYCLPCDLQFSTDEPPQPERHLYINTVRDGACIKCGLGQDDPQANHFPAKTAEHPFTDNGKGHCTECGRGRRSYEANHKKPLPLATCEFCGAENQILLARLIADPNQRVCKTCHDDPRVPTILLPPIAEVWIERAEGMSDDPTMKPVTFTGVNAELDGNTWLRFISETAPRDGCYDKTDVEITLTTGEEFSGRFDVKHYSCEDADIDIRTHFRDMLVAICAPERFPHIAADKRWLSRMQANHTPEEKRDAARLLAYLCPAEPPVIIAA